MKTPSRIRRLVSLAETLLSRRVYAYIREQSCVHSEERCFAKKEYGETGIVNSRAEGPFRRRSVRDYC